MRMVGKGWMHEQLLVAFWLYCQLPFGKLHAKNPLIIQFAQHIGRTPSALAMKLVNIASLDPAITSTGRKGLDGASQADRKMWVEMQSDWDAFATQSAAAVAALGVGDEALEESAECDEPAPSYIGSTKPVISQARVGQSFFRRAVLSAYDDKCCITGWNNSRMLVASHIVPWRADAVNRLNPRNGLSLSVLHDKAFDLGWLTISEDFKVKISKAFHAQGNAFFSHAFAEYDGCAIALPKKFAPSQEFLAYHREHIFRE
jgi:hypothetical protein